MLRFFRASRSIQVGTPEVRARSPFSRGRALARSPIGRMRHPVYTKSRLSAAAESLLFGICIRKRYSISLKRPSGRRRFCAVRAFCRRQNLGAGRIHFARAFQSLEGGAALWVAESQEMKTSAEGGCFHFLEGTVKIDILCCSGSLSYILTPRIQLYFSV